MLGATAQRKAALRTPKRKNQRVVLSVFRHLSIYYYGHMYVR